MNPNPPFINPFEVGTTPEARAYELGRRDGQMQMPRPPEWIDDLKQIVSYGDFVVRKVNNGYLIREVPHEGGMINSWVVEGGLTEVAKQLTAIQATREIENANMTGTDMMTRARLTVNIPKGIGQALGAGNYAGGVIK